jgi:serine/threonine protein kinase
MPSPAEPDVVRLVHRLGKRHMKDKRYTPGAPDIPLADADTRVRPAESSAGDRGSGCNLLESLAQDFVERFRRGERPALSEYSKKHPALAAKIRDLFPTLALLEGARPTDTVSHPSQRPVPQTQAPEQLGDYRILREVGRGGMGIVYEAEQGALGRRVALKMLPPQMMLDPRLLQRFRIEARAAAKLHHTNIVPVFGVGEQDGLHYYVMQFIPGQGLDSVLDELASARDRRSEAGPPPCRLFSQRGPAHWKSVARIGIQAAEALAYAHAHGTLHRDIKPSNLLLDSEGIVWVTDFGLAKAADGDDLTHTGDLVGTLRYMAPERFKGKTDVRSDVYSLGLTLYEMLTLRPAFDQSESNELLYQVANVEPPPPRKLCPAVPRDLETIVLKAIAYHPRCRYQSASELADDLRRFADDSPIRARAVHVLERVWRWCRRNPWPTYLLLAILLTAGVGFWHLSRLSASLVRFSALQATALQSEMFDELNDFYSAHVVDRAKRSGIEASEHYATRPGAIPSPATFTIELGRQISRHTERGLEVRLYSDYPFRSRKDGGICDCFERQALTHLRRVPHEPYYRFEEHQGRPVLRYATARRMKESCIKCHNTHPDSPKTDWRVGDVRGVLEIIHPLDKDVCHTREGLRGSFLLVGGICAAFLLCFGVILHVGKWQTVPPMHAG